MCGEINEKKLEKVYEIEGIIINWILGEIFYFLMYMCKGKVWEDVCSCVLFYLLCFVVL